MNKIILCVLLFTSFFIFVACNSNVEVKVGSLHKQETKEHNNKPNNQKDKEFRNDHLLRYERRNPLSLFERSFGRTFKDLWNRFDEDWDFFGRDWSCVNTFYPKADIFETKDEYLFMLDVPGVKKEDVSIDVKTVDDKDVITIKGKRGDLKYPEGINLHLSERQFGSFTRSWVFQKRVKKGEVIAKMENGILSINVPKIKPKKEDEQTFSVKIL